MVAQNKAQAVYAFFSDFSWPAYDASTTPDDAPLPRITYETITNGFDEVPAALSASLWDRTMSWSTVEEKAAEIATSVGGGTIVHYDGGAAWIKLGTPWTQRMAEPSDDSIRRLVLNFEVEYFS